MVTIQIYCLDNSELADFEAINRGYRKDIYVKVSDRYYHLNIYDIVRLQQDFESELEDYGAFSPDPNLVIVKEVNHMEIKKLANHLYKQKYFEEIKPVENSKIQQLELITIQ